MPHLGSATASGCVFPSTGEREVSGELLWWSRAGAHDSRGATEEAEHPQPEKVEAEGGSDDWLPLLLGWGGLGRRQILLRDAQ